jgi:hypothetical protein
MTIGIGAFGPNAGASVLAGWAEAERTGEGSIGGFAVACAITGGGETISLECQRGGLPTVLAEQAGSSELGAFSSAPIAAVITSGPDRPEPLSQFLVSGPSGLVTGHRLPNRASAHGRPMNVEALAHIGTGISPDVAVAQVAAENPEVDAGLIAVTRDAIGLADTRLVLAREDGGALLERGCGWGLAILHNSIVPVAGYARAVAAVMYAGIGQYDDA